MQNFFFKDRFRKPIYMHLLLKIIVFPENMGMRLDKKEKKKIDYGGWGPYGPPNIGYGQKS